MAGLCFGIVGLGVIPKKDEHFISHPVGSAVR
jgi:hypothetical protein